MTLDDLRARLNGLRERVPGNTPVRVLDGDSEDDIGRDAVRLDGAVILIDLTAWDEEG